MMEMMIPLKEHPRNEDTSLIRTLDQVPTLYTNMYYSPPEMRTSP